MADGNDVMNNLKSLDAGPICEKVLLNLDECVTNIGGVVY